MATAEAAKPDPAVVEEVPGWVRLYDDGSVDRAETGPPVAAFLTAAVAPHDDPRNGDTLHDLPDTDPPLRLYLPADLAAGEGPRRPLLLHFHGGGFCITHPSWTMYHRFYSHLAAAAAAPVLSVALPLAPERRLPAAFDAGFKALLWLRDLARGPSPAPPPSTAAELIRSSADFSRVFLVGDSSGGNVAHEVAAMAGAAEAGSWEPLRLAGAVLLNPGFARSSRSRSELENSPTPFMTLEMMDKFLALGLPVGATKDHPYVCPMGPAAPAMEGLALPPVMVAVAEGDLLKDRQEEYAAAMAAAGKEVKVLVSEGVAHCFFLYGEWVDTNPLFKSRTEELIEAIKDFVHRH